MRILMMLMVAVAACGPAQAQRVFRASSIDVEQNQRLDNVEAEVAELRSIVTNRATAREPRSTPASSQPATESPPQVEVEDSRVIVRYGDMKNVDGVDYSLQEVEGAPRWMPIETTTPSAQAAYSTAPVAQSLVSVAQPKSSRYTTAEIQAQIRQLRPSGSTAIQYADVQPRSWAKSHLVGEHGYTSAQVAGLSANEAVILHDLRHGGKVSPMRSGQSSTRTVQRSYSGPSAAYTVSASTYMPQPSSGCPNGQCPLTQPTYTTQSSGGCPNGQCPTSYGSSRTVTRQRTGLLGGWFR